MPGTSFDAMVRRARMETITAEDEPGLLDRADSLAVQLASALRAHLSCQKGAKIRDSGHDFQLRWYPTLRDLLCQALMIKVRLEFSSDTYHAIWAEADTAFDRRTMESQGKQGHVVSSGIFGGIALTQGGREEMICKARVDVRT